jgi:hypothetical protein
MVGIKEQIDNAITAGANDIDAQVHLTKRVPEEV